MTSAIHSEAIDERELVRTARITGLFYLGLCITGLFGFLIIRGQIFDPENAAATLSHLAGQELLARLGIAMELGMAITQTLVALWFFRLFRTVDAFLAGCLAAFGLVNAIAVLVSSALLATALDLALKASLGGDPRTAQLLYVISGHLWTGGGLFFGLWLIPMGLLVLRSGWMPRPLGWVLIVGGVGYIVNTFTVYVAPSAAVVTMVLPVIAAVGEFWTMGYLLVFGVRRSPAISA
jgi:hypothetical protein